MTWLAPVRGAVMSHHRNVVGFCRLKKQEEALGMDSSGSGKEPEANCSGHGDEMSGSK